MAEETRKKGVVAAIRALWEGQSPDEHAKMAVVKPKYSQTYSMSEPTRALFKFHGTILPLVLLRGEIWIFTILHCALLIATSNSQDLRCSMGLDTGSVCEDVTAEVEAGSGDVKVSISEPTLRMTWTAVSIPTMMVTFFLVFFNGQCYSRFLDFYKSCTGISGRLQEVGAQLVIHLPMERHLERRRHAFRYLIASAIVVYLKVTDPPGGPQVVDDDEWNRLMMEEEEWAGVPVMQGGQKVSCPPLLTAEEVEKLKAYPGNSSLLLQTWSLRVMRLAMREAGCNENVYVAAEESVLELRRNCSGIMNTLAMPVPFPYFHALNLLMWIVYTLFAFAFLDFNSYVTPVILFLIILVMTGMRETSAALSNPFGDDDVDFPVQSYIQQLRCILDGFVLSADTWPPGLPVPAHASMMGCASSPSASPNEPASPVLPPVASSRQMPPPPLDPSLFSPSRQAPASFYSQPQAYTPRSAPLRLPNGIGGQLAHVDHGGAISIDIPAVSVLADSNDHAFALGPTVTSSRGRRFAHRVEAVVSERGSGAMLEYRIKWEGFKSGGCMTWELASQLLSHAAGFAEALQEYDEGLKRDATRTIIHASSASSV